MIKNFLAAVGLWHLLRIGKLLLKLGLSLVGLALAGILLRGAWVATINSQTAAQLQVAQADLKVANDYLKIVVEQRDNLEKVRSQLRKDFDSAASQYVLVEKQRRETAEDLYTCRLALDRAAKPIACPKVSPKIEVCACPASPKVETSASPKVETFGSWVCREYNSGRVLATYDSLAACQKDREDLDSYSCYCHWKK